jgi:RNA polymerase sigma-70 factor (ECF subfamily)
VESEVAARIDLHRLQGAFDDLTENQRETLEMYYFEGLGLREISQQLNEPLGNVRHRFYRGLNRLRRSAIVQKARSRENGKSSKSRESQKIRGALRSGAD